MEKNPYSLKVGDKVILDKHSVNKCTAKILEFKLHGIFSLIQSGTETWTVPTSRLTPIT